MHPNPIYRGTHNDRNIAFARARGFGVLALNGEAAPVLSQVPFLLSENGEVADLHLVRSNPIARMTLPEQAVIAVTGPDGYVSPDWYGIDDQVPTWNYIAVHLRGALEPLPPAALPDLLARQSAHFETRLAGKSPWTLDKMSADALDRMLRQILPFRLHISEITGTWKLNQNKPDEVRHRAADNITSGIGNELATLSQLMNAAKDP